MEFGCERWLEESLREILPGNPEHRIYYSDLEQPYPTTNVPDSHEEMDYLSSSEINFP